jgi:hypothetical protein
MLLTRDEFRAAVFKRDGHKCVSCDNPPEGVKLDAHHIMERRLWPDGGYYLDNGASLCEPCHLQAEQTYLSCENLREFAGITRVLLPPHLYDDVRYDKWGNIIIENGMRLRGELFDDESVQKVLKHILHLFTNRVKYPRTYHLPWSPGVTKDDRVVEDVEAMFSGKEIVVTEKMDGENTTMYRDYLHARSLDYSPHASRDRVKAMWAAIAHDIPEGWRVCGENLFAEHSLHYSNLESYFYIFSVWNEKNVCLSWNETREWAQLLGFPTVPRWFSGKFYIIGQMGLERMFDAHALVEGEPACEGYVVRNAGEFHYKDFRHNVAKYVRANHVQHKDGHWVNRQVVPNDLRKD